MNFSPEAFGSDLSEPSFVQLPNYLSLTLVKSSSINFSISSFPSFHNEMEEAELVRKFTPSSLRSQKFEGTQSISTANLKRQLASYYLLLGWKKIHSILPTFIIIHRPDSFAHIEKYLPNNHGIGNLIITLDGKNNSLNIIVLL